MKMQAGKSGGRSSSENLNKRNTGKAYRAATAPARKAAKSAAKKK